MKINIIFTFIIWCISRIFILNKTGLIFLQRNYWMEKSGRCQPEWLDLTSECKFAKLNGYFAIGYDYPMAHMTKESHFRGETSYNILIKTLWRQSCLCLFGIMYKTGTWVKTVYIINSEFMFIWKSMSFRMRITCVQTSVCVRERQIRSVEKWSETLLAERGREALQFLWQVEKEETQIKLWGTESVTERKAWGRVPWITEQMLWDTETWQAGWFWRALLDPGAEGRKAEKKDQKNIQSEVMGSVSELCVSSFQAFLCPTIPRSSPGKSWHILHGVLIITNMFSVDSVVNATIITTVQHSTVT